MTYEWHDLVGNIGVFCILAAYLLLQLEQLKADQLIYLLLNAAGAALILISLAVSFNLSAFIIEACWLLISLVGLYRYWNRIRINQKETIS